MDNSGAAVERPPAPAAPAAPAAEADKENAHAGINLCASNRQRGGRLAAMNALPGPAASPASGVHQRAYASLAACRAAAVPANPAAGGEAGPAAGLEPGQAEAAGPGHAAAEAHPGEETAAAFVAQLVAATRAGGSPGSADAAVAADRSDCHERPAWAAGSSRGASAAEQEDAAPRLRQAKRKGCAAQLPMPEALRRTPDPGPAAGPEEAPFGQLDAGLAEENDPPVEAAGPNLHEQEGLQEPLSGSGTADATAAAPACSGERQGHEAGQVAARGLDVCAPVPYPGSDAAREMRRACTPPVHATSEVWGSAAGRCAPRAPCMPVPTHAPAGDAANLLRDLGLDSPEATQAGSLEASPRDAADAAPGSRAAPEADGAASPSAEELAAVLARYDDAYVVQVLPCAARLSTRYVFKTFSCSPLQLL